VAGFTGDVEAARLEVSDVVNWATKTINTGSKFKWIEMGKVDRLVGAFGKDSEKGFRKSREGHRGRDSSMGRGRCSRRQGRSWLGSLWRVWRGCRWKRSRRDEVKVIP